jgi:hypothetical protein
MFRRLDAMSFGVTIQMIDFVRDRVEKRAARVGGVVLALVIVGTQSVASASDETLAEDLLRVLSDNNPTESKAIQNVMLWKDLCADYLQLQGGEAARGDAHNAAEKRWRETDFDALSAIVDRARGTPYFDAAEQSMDVVAALRERSESLFAWRTAFLAGDAPCDAPDSTRFQAFDGDYLFSLSRLGLNRAHIETLLTQGCGPHWDRSCEPGGNLVASYFLLSHMIALYCSVLDGMGTVYPACASLLRHDSSPRAALARYGEILDHSSAYLVEELNRVNEEIGDASCDEIACDPEIDSFVRWAPGAIILGTRDRKIAKLFMEIDFDLNGDGEIYEEARSHRFSLGQPYYLLWNLDGPDVRQEAIEEFSRQ